MRQHLPRKMADMTGKAILPLVAALAVPPRGPGPLSGVDYRDRLTPAEKKARLKTKKAKKAAKQARKKNRR